jgi:hypothetical protein
MTPQNQYYNGTSPVVERVNRSWFKLVNPNLKRVWQIFTALLPKLYPKVLRLTKKVHLYCCLKAFIEIADCIPRGKLFHKCTNDVFCGKAQ